MSDLSGVYVELRKLMKPYAGKLVVTSDTDSELCLNTRHIRKNKQPLFFGAVQQMKNYVSYHLMPVYVRPELLKGVSPALKKRMQGKSCFNFIEVDKPLFKELAALTRASFKSYEEQGLLE